jgi:hypothetical protein
LTRQLGENVAFDFFSDFSGVARQPMEFEPFSEEEKLQIASYKSRYSSG